MDNNKKIIITVLSVLVVAMAVGYALLAQELTINGRASIDSTWKVEITNITQKEINGGVTEKAKSYTSTTANFDIGFTQPGDYVIYDIEVTNSGTLDAVISDINIVTDNNPAIIYTTSGLKKGNTITKNGEKKYLTLKIEYDSNITSQPISNGNNITIEMDYQQDLGQVPAYEYSIGDTVEFAGSNWYVIKNSAYDENYVVLLKEKVLTYNELGSDYATIAYGEQQDRMGFYWSDTCHDRDRYCIYGQDGYLQSDYSDCEHHNDYSGSKIREFLENTYIYVLGATNLKEVDGYKIRLITWEELLGNLGFSMAVTSANAGVYPIANENVPNWVYENHASNLYATYWTMSAPPNNSESVRTVMGHYGHLETDPVYNSHAVRPVINLLKSAIE